MSQTTLYLIATGLILAGPILLVTGLQGTTWVCQAGLVAVSLAMTLSTRWVADAEDRQRQDGVDRDARSGR
ncbi:MAG: hypothetical protein HPY83_02165 [Anaerolineae bacterium]|nr:hypothetical protein [Anaerolineae bacterium]